MSARSKNSLNEHSNSPTRRFSAQGGLFQNSARVALTHFGMRSTAERLWVSVGSGVNSRIKARHTDTWAGSGSLGERSVGGFNISDDPW